MYSILPWEDGRSRHAFVVGCSKRLDPPRETWGVLDLQSALFLVACHGEHFSFRQRGL